MGKENNQFKSLKIKSEIDGKYGKIFSIIDIIV